MSHASLFTSFDTVGSCSMEMLRPWHSALRDARLRPDLLFGPVLARALARFDVILAKLVMRPCCPRRELAERVVRAPCIRHLQPAARPGAAAARICPGDGRFREE